MDLKCVVLDDDPMARKFIEQMVNETDSLELTKSYSSPIECINFLSSNKVDLLFLDVEMPEMSGMEMASSLNEQPLIIFTTGNKDYALNSFEHRVVDYLVKPFNYARFLKAVMKAREILKSSPQGNHENTIDYIFIKQPGQFIKLPFSEVMYLEALGDYINIFAREKKYTLHETLKNFLNRLPQNFIRVHRSFVVNADFISSIEDSTIYMQGKAIPIGVSYREAVYKKFKLG